MKDYRPNGDGKADKVKVRSFRNFSPEFSTQFSREDSSVKVPGSREGTGGASLADEPCDLNAWLGPER